MKNTNTTTPKPDFTTKHSIERVKHRLGVNQRKAKKRINDAIERGRTAENFSSWERAFLENVTTGNYFAVAYNGYCYIVNSLGVCVTLYPLPRCFTIQLFRLISHCSA